MSAKFLIPTFIGAALIGLAAAPAMAQTFGTAPSFYYESPDGSYPSASDDVRDLRGIPCGIECTREAEIRWGMVRGPHYAIGIIRFVVTGLAVEPSAIRT